MRVRTLLMVLALVFAAVPQSAAALSKDAKQEVANLQQQLNALGDEYVALDATRASIVAEEQRLKDVDELLKGVEVGQVEAFVGFHPCAGHIRWGGVGHVLPHAGKMGSALTLPAFARKTSVSFAYRSAS